MSGYPLPPERVAGGPYTIHPDALNQPYGVPQEVVGDVAADLMAAVNGAGYSWDEVVFAGYHAVGEEDDAGPALQEPNGEVIDPGTKQPARGLESSLAVRGLAALSASQDEGTNPIHDAGTTPDARIGVYDYEAVRLGADVPLADPDTTELHVDPRTLRGALALIFHPQYEAGGRGSVRETTDPDDLIGSDPALGRLAAQDRGLPPADQR